MGFAVLFADVKNKTLSELYQLLEERKKEQLNMRIQMRMGQEFKAHKMRETRRSIAKILTQLTQLKKKGA